MNKNDIKLILILLFIIIIIFIFYFINKKPANIALVYHDKELVLKIDLSKNNTYSVQGDLGIVKIRVKDNKIKVEEETSNYHLCSKQGYVSNTSESIICLPNKIIIELPNSNIDTEVR